MAAATVERPGTGKRTKRVLKIATAATATKATANQKARWMCAVTATAAAGYR